MKLYLSSYRIPSPHALAQLINISDRPATVAIIPNAKDYYANRARAFKIEQTKQFLIEQGFAPTVLDLREYDNPEAIKKALQGVDMLWVGGGNTFCLRYEMQRSGFEHIIAELLENGLVYAGEIGRASCRER